MSISATGMRPGRSSTGMSPSLNVGKAKSGYRPAQMQQFTPEQMKLFQQWADQLGPDSFLSRLAKGEEGIFDELEAPAMRQFQGLQGNIASRFSGMGSGGARRSSGFQNTMNQATSDFASKLQSQRMGLQRNAIRDLSDITSSLLGQRPYENFLMKEEPSGWQQFLSSLGGGAAQGFGSIFGANKLGLFK